MYNLKFQDLFKRMARLDINSRKLLFMRFSWFVSNGIKQVENQLSNWMPCGVNSSPYEDGWIIKVELENYSDLHCLMDPARYTEFCEKEDASH
ncbi:glycine cleavage system H protein, mitochondrial-like [Salvia miltiorrhiza]|uniref:glycine cleavage system H protein, mitochondrial-like n=1 Tax=Salvia miltiorrhiza TaxID=226208 RepID=UPI0025AC79C6|nr:glycine cleavage system H protein, mitochondrial-like [Salvia miltiorrhiza]